MTQPGGYSPKDLHFGEEARSKLIQGLDKLYEAVSSTLGPLGQTVLIESPDHTRGITVTKDGVTVAKSISLLDPVENLAVRMVREAAEKTASRAGDGTTTAIVIANAIINRAYNWELDTSNIQTNVLRSFDKAANFVIEQLHSKAQHLDDQKLLDVATISCNNDPHIGKIIAQTYKDVGKSGIVTIEKSDSSTTYSETTKGIKIDRGYSSHLFINDHKKDQCILNDVHVLVCDAEINNILAIEAVLKPIISENKKLLIVAPCSQNVINTLAANVMKNNLKLCTIIPPNFGYKQQELMNDIALSVGATYFSESTGDDLSLITLKDLGIAQKVIVSKSETIIIKDETIDNKDQIEERVEQLREQEKLTEDNAEKKFVRQRIATLTGAIGVIHVGGATDLEQKELYDRVDDAVHAVKAALDEGILPGGGVALRDIYYKHYITKGKARYETNDPETIAYQIILEAIYDPFNKIKLNAGIKLNTPTIKDLMDEEVEQEGMGVNVKTSEKGNMIEMGIIDPLKVTKEALLNAVAVSKSILSTNAIVTMARTYESKN
tara:strand:- start:5755 stop:7404 length:1650 start_codon:yes stop_codon:yes gene_type:complete